MRKKTKNRHGGFGLHVLLAVLMMLVPQGAWADSSGLETAFIGDKSYYVLRSNADWLKFRDMVDDSQGKEVNAIMDADFTIEKSIALTSGVYYNGTFNYMLLDQILDFCVDHRIKVFLDLAQRKEVAMASEQSVIYETDDSTVFESAFEWMNALSSVLGHIRKRYGEHIAGSWIYEISFFLNDKPYYISDSYRSSLAYEQSYAVIRRCLPAARIAAPGLPGMSDSDTCELLISELLKTKYPPDIFTSIHFPYGLNFSSSDESIYQERYRKIIDYDFLDSHLDIVNSVLAAKGFQGEHWITDWGNSIANRNYLQDSCYRAVYLADSALRNYKKVGAMGIFYASDSLNAFFDSNKILSGSAGILTQNGIRKPAYYAFKFMSSLGRYLIERGDRYIITCENDRDIRILCWNRIPPDKDYFLSEENSRNPHSGSTLRLSLRRRTRCCHCF